MDFSVAIVGRPNVGKSALFNRIAGTSSSIVHRQSGVTRDRLYARCEWQGQEFTLIDTGGLDLSSSGEMVKAIISQVDQAMKEADILVFVVDARVGIMPEDLEVAQILRKTQKPVLVAANKCDGLGQEQRAVEFYSLGFPTVFPISAAHGLGTGDLLDAIVEQAEGLENVPPEEIKEADEEGNGPIRVAIVGKPNVGKSSLVNQILGQERMTVSSVPGTTVDSVDVEFSYDGKDFVLVDTAGLRRPARIDEKLEELAVGRALRAIKRADVVLLLIDGTDYPTSQDRRIAGYIMRNAKASVILVNKVDLGLAYGMSQREYRDLVLHECRPIAYSNVFFVSCLTGKGINMILPEVIWTYEEYHKRIETSVLNRALSEITDFNPPPRDGKLFYCSQVEKEPPKIVFFVKDPSAIPQSYARYLEAEIRRRFGFRGVPIIMEFRPRR
ncbi:MAG: ribosome biogenesis GTPase Der [Firmicutes bacterium]|jgi:GTP-binding protein|nr:ribosome biogenesis GTPase Der [Candidatus Fermentithermobacillaceae bacterium]